MNWLSNFSQGVAKAWKRIPKHIRASILITVATLLGFVSEDLLAVTPQNRYATTVALCAAGVLTYIAIELRKKATKKK
jgi:hypothetical protein